MKKQLLWLLLAGLPAFQSLQAQEQTGGQERRNSVYLEIGGASNGVGVSYDLKLKDLPIAFRAGLGFGYQRASDIYSGSSTRFYGIPLEAKYLVGRNRSKLELGLGVNIFWVNMHEPQYALHYTELSTESGYNLNGYTIDYLGQKTINKVGNFVFANIGYRHISKRGFMFRAGLTPGFNITQRYYVDAAAPSWKNNDSKKVNWWVAPYVSFGWAF
ncbi:hypothetical protein [Segatella buccae]|uniref:hypothetical protein n=1 Tax=Segatella buccae TaxID=28126 RepID=UPI003FD77820